MSSEDLLLVDDDDGNTLDNRYLLFNLGEEHYGVAIKHIVEIIEVQKITKVPDMPDFIKGVINLRGKVIPLMDLRLRLGLEAKNYDDRTCILIVNIEESILGFIVDTVSEVKEIPEKDIDPPLKYSGKDKREQFIKGLGKVSQEVKILIDAQKILTEDELTAIQKNDSD